MLKIPFSKLIKVGYMLQIFEREVQFIFNSETQTN